MTMNPPSNHEDENTQEGEHLEQNWACSFTQRIAIHKKKKSTLFGDLFIVTAEIDVSQFAQFVGDYNLQKQA